MSVAAPGAFGDRQTAAAFLRQLGAQEEDELPLAPAALALASLDRPEIDADPYHRHLAGLAAAVAEAAGAAGDIAACVAALNRVLFEDYGYAGDTLTYEDPQNANLMRVVDRRRGLPVALGILCLHTARAQGWSMVGLSFPGHFLVRLEQGGRRVILDPFNGGRERQAGELRELLIAIAGERATLAPEHYAPVSDRAVLLRLQNNLKLRYLENREQAKALAIVEGMMLFAPRHAALWHEAGSINAQLGNLRAAVTALETCLALTEDEGERRRVTALLDRLRAHLN